MKRYLTLLLAAQLVPSFVTADTRLPTTDKGFGHSLNKPRALRHAMQDLDWFDKHLFGATLAK